MPIIPLIRSATVNVTSGDNTHLIYIPAWVFLFLCPAVVGTRIWSRKKTCGHLGADDYTILLSLAFAMVTDSLMLWGCYYGYGKHAASLTAHQSYEAFKSFYLTQITYKTSINLTKASILLLYLRIFGGVKWFRWACFSVLALVAAYCIAAVIATIFQCIPVRAAFDKTITHKTCISNEHFWFSNAGFSISTDIIILTMPMPLVYSLQIPRLQKAALVLVFTVGAFVVITSCLRATTLDLQATSRDPLYDVESTMWTIIEMSVAIICACLPQIRPLVVKLFPKTIPSYFYPKEIADHHVAFGGSLLRSSSSRHQRPSESEDNWSRTECQDSVTLANVPKRSNSSSEAPPIPADATTGSGIQKTMQYSVEYSKDGKATEV